MRVASRLEFAIELALNRRHIDNMLVALRRRHHEGFQPGIENKRSDGIYQLGLEQLDGRHFGKHQPPGIAVAQIDLLQILIQLTFRKKVRLRLRFFGEQGCL